MESIKDYLIRNLKAVSSDRWEAIAEAAGVAKSLPRKLVYERPNPGVETVQPLLDYFKAVERGTKALPVKAEA